MTTLYSATGLGSTLTVECDGDIVHLTAFSSAETCRAWANPKRADLLAALDAVPRAEVVSELREARAERDEATAERIEVDAENSTLRATVKHLAAVTAERDALAETVERVKALASEWLLMGRITREKGSQLSAALTPPKPAFELPTEPGVRFKATDNCSKPCVFLSVWNGPDIAFVNERTSVIWDGENVLKYCTDHRLLDGAE